MGLLGAIKGVAVKALDTLSAAFIKPVETIQAIISPTKKVSDVIKSVNEQSLTKNITSTIVNTAVAATAVVGVGAVATKGVSAVATSLIPTTTKGKIIAAVSAPIITGAIISQPAKTLSAAANLPSNLANVGGNIAELAANPSIENLKNLVTENPVIVGGVAAVGAVLGAKALFPAIATARQTEAIQEQTEAIKGATGQLTTTEIGGLINQKPLSTDGKTAVTPETTTITTGKRRRRVKAKEKTGGNINQRVNLFISNKSNSVGIRATKKYLNREVLLN